MITILVWLLITTQDGKTESVTIHPQKYPDKTQCEHVRRNINPTYVGTTKCVQAKIIKDW